MARSCWACGQQNDGGTAHCVNPACGLPLTPAEAAAPDTPVLPTRPCYLRMLALPAGITMVIVLAAVHALMAPLHGSLSPEQAANTGPTPPASHRAVAGGPSPPDNPAFPLPSRTGTTTRPSGPPVPSPPAHVHDGPVSGAYAMKSLTDGCFDIGYTSTQAPMVAQRPCSSTGPVGRFDLQALGDGRYRITAIPQRGIEAGQALCVSPAGIDKIIMFDGCETERADQILVFTETGNDIYQIQVNGGCVTAMGREARTRACGSSQAQRFTFTPIS